MLGGRLLSLVMCLKVGGKEVIASKMLALSDALLFPSLSMHLTRLKDKFSPVINTQLDL